MEEGAGAQEAQGALVPGAAGAVGAVGALETEQERRERWRSIYVIYFTMFQMSLGFSIVLTGVWPYLDKELSVSCERIFAGGRRADLDRWYVSLGNAMVHAVQHADHPRTPRAVVHMENFHRLHGVVSLVRAGSLEPLRRECKARYAAALRAYVTQYFGRPLEKLTLFFEGVSECVSGGVREDEVCYRAAYSKHELKRLLALYPAHEVRKSLHRLYRTVEKHLSEEGGLLQVVWRAMQEEFLAQTLALQSRIATCYAGAGLSMPLTTQDILDAFSDIAREH